MFPAFFDLVKPDSSNAKPACIKKINAVAANTQAVFAAEYVLITSPFFSERRFLSAFPEIGHSQAFRFSRSPFFIKYTKAHDYYGHQIRQHIKKVLGNR